MTSIAQRIAPDAIRLERLLPGPIEKVWEFLTVPEQRARWLAGGEWELRPGGTIELHFAHDQISAEPTPAKYRDMQMKFTGKVLRIEPPRLIEFTWLESHGVPTEVTFELAPKDGQVLLAITHRRIDSREELLDIAGGWDVHTGILEDVLSDRAPRGFWSTHASLTDEYALRFTP